MRRVKGGGVLFVGLLWGRDGDGEICLRGMVFCVRVQVGGFWGGPMEVCVTITWMVRCGLSLES